MFTVAAVNGAELDVQMGAAALTRLLLETPPAASAHVTTNVLSSGELVETTMLRPGAQGWPSSPLSLVRPGELAEISAGNMGPFDVSQGSLLIAAVVVTIPDLMIVVSAATPFPCSLAQPRSGRPLRSGQCQQLIGESWAHYLFFGVLEIGLGVWVAAYSRRWRGKSTPA